MFASGRAARHIATTVILLIVTIGIQCKGDVRSSHSGVNQEQFQDACVVAGDHLFIIACDPLAQLYFDLWDHSNDSVMSTSGKSTSFEYAEGSADWYIGASFVANANSPEDFYQLLADREADRPHPMRARGSQTPGGPGADLRQKYVSFMHTEWPERSERLRPHIAYLRQVASEGICAIDGAARSLGFSRPPSEIRIVVLDNAPFDKAATVLGCYGDPVIYLDCSELDGHIALEVLIHEAMHALDFIGQGQDGVLGHLRKAMREIGLPEDTAGFWEVPHMVINAEAAWWVGECSKTDYVGVFERRQLSEPSDEYASMVWSIWSGHLGEGGAVEDSIATVCASLESMLR